MFMYHMMGNHVGSLIVAQRRSSSGVGDIHWALHGSQGTQWTQGAVSLKLSYEDGVRHFFKGLGTHIGTSEKLV